MRDVLVMILAGGQGSRLYPLTADRAKPAVPFGGKYRIIDFVLSNFVNSGFFKIKVLTQYKSESLNRHLARGWRMSNIADQYVESVPAQQRLGPRWYLGSADAIYQNINLIYDENPTDVCVFGGDHVYKMDVFHMLRFHRDNQADLTVAAIPFPVEQASAFGVIEVDEHNRMIGFEEKPANPKPMPNAPNMALVSMGNYMFTREALIDEVRLDAEQESSEHDFGKNIITRSYKKGVVYVYDFNQNRLPGQNPREIGYWRDIGTIDAYMAAHMDLVSVHPIFDLYNRRWPIHSHQVPAPPAKFVHETGDRVGTATNSIVSHGCIISGGRIQNSVLFGFVRVNSYSHIDHAVILEEVNVGRHARLKNCIVDKGVVIPEGLQVGYDPDFDRRHFHVSDQGMVVIGKGQDLSHLV
ncbi:MAG: glucose-1-phosphate adenylyltransferase [Bradymonadales bacterium]|nr:glucose-1-phosphate adenylyltransferase [Bradymonadales bacterium]